MCIFILLSPDIVGIGNYEERHFFHFLIIIVRYLKPCTMGWVSYTVNGFNSFSYHTIIIPTKKKKRKCHMVFRTIMPTASCL
jgi:hypothetical protein